MAHLIVDSSALLACFDASEPDHGAVEEVLTADTDLLIVSPYLTAALDHLVSTRHGVEAELAVQDEVMRWRADASNQTGSDGLG